MQELAQSREDEDKRYGIQETEIQNSLHELDVSLDQNRKLFLSALDMAPQLRKESLEQANATLKDKAANVTDALATTNRQKLEVEREVVKKETQRQGLMPQHHEKLGKINELTTSGDDGVFQLRQRGLRQKSCGFAATSP